MGSNSPYRQRQVLPETDLWNLSQQFSSDNYWDSDTALAPDDGHDLDNPAYYGVNLTNTEAREVKEDYGYVMEIEKSINLVQTSGIPDGYAAQWNPRRVPVILPFPEHIFEVDPELLPWNGYVFDLPAFGFWIYRCRQGNPALRDLEPPLRFYRCLYNLGENELKGRKMIDDGNTNQDLRSWLDQCSAFARLLMQRVEICYGRVPSGGTDTYPGLLIADYLFGPQSLSWITRYVRMIVQSNKMFTRNFEQASRRFNTANTHIEDWIQNSALPATYRNISRRKMPM